MTPNRELWFYWFYNELQRGAIGIERELTKSCIDPTPGVVSKRPDGSRPYMTHGSATLRIYYDCRANEMRIYETNGEALGWLLAADVCGDPPVPGSVLAERVAINPNHAVRIKGRQGVGGAASPRSLPLLALHARELRRMVPGAGQTGD